MEQPLYEYAWLVDAVRRHQSEKMDLNAAVDATIDEMPDAYMIKKFLIENRAEVKSMFLTEYNEEKVLEKEREEGRMEGRKEGRLEGRKEGREERDLEIAAKLIKEGGLSASFISRISDLSVDAVRSLAKSMGTVVG